MIVRMREQEDINGMQRGREKGRGIRSRRKCIKVTQVLGVPKLLSLLNECSEV